MEVVRRAIPANASPEIQAAFRDLHQELDELSRRDRTQDLHGSRIGNTGIPRAPRDYANKGYVDAVIKQALVKVDIALKKFRVVRTTGGGTGGPPPPPPPPPVASMDFGYWYVDSIHAHGGGQHEETVKAWTNLVFVFDRDGGDSDVTDSERKANLVQICQRIADAGFKIALDIGPNAFLSAQDMLEVAAPVWERVFYVLLGDEKDFNDSVAEANKAIKDAKMMIANMGLGAKTIGVTLTVEDGLNSPIVEANWGFLNIEAYTDSGCQSETCPDPAAIKVVEDNIKKTIARIPAAIDIAIVMMAYDLSGALTNIQQLAKLNAATYFKMAKGNPRVKMINMFAWSRSNFPNEGGGSIFYPELVNEHKKIWADLGGGGGQTGGAKKCAGDPENCEGTPVCCDGGNSNPCNCPRLCEGGLYMNQVESGTTSMVAAHGELFVPDSLPLKLLDQDAGVQLVAFIAAYIITTYPLIKAINDPNDGKQMLVRQFPVATFREDYRVWNSDLTIALPSGSGYRATCWGVDVTW